MTPLNRALIEKLGHDYGFELVIASATETVLLGSARHPAKVEVLVSAQGYLAGLRQGPQTLPMELDRTFGHWTRQGDAYLAVSEADLAVWLRRTSELARSLPNQAAVDFESQVKQALAKLPAQDLQSTEVQRLVRQRVGQDRYRQAMLGYWGSACAVTGLTLPAALRASHAKPWADCDTDAQRLDVFNGFLLSANLDALFDKFLISFSDAGELIVSSLVSDTDRQLLGLHVPRRLRWIAAEHLPYLAFHRGCMDKSAPLRYSDQHTTN